MDVKNTILRCIRSRAEDQSQTHVNGEKKKKKNMGDALSQTYINITTQLWGV